MLFAWMLYSLGVSALLALAASGAEWAMRGARPVRSVWALAMVLTVTLGVTAPFRTQSVSSVRPSTLQSAATVSDASASAVVLEKLPSNISPIGSILRGIKSNRTAPLANVLSAPLRSVGDFVTNIPPTVARSVVIAWVALSLCLLLAAFTVYARFAAMRQRWPRRLLLGQSVRVSEDVGPAAMGIAPSEIVVPAWVFDRDVAQQQLVIAHELEHVRARDPLLLIAGGFMALLAPWNVALWFMWSRLRLAVELDCDQRVLDRGASKPYYANLLVDLSAARPAGMSFTPAFSFGRSHLEARLLAMTAQRTKTRLTVRMAGAAFVGALLVVACNSRPPVAATSQAKSSENPTLVPSSAAPRKALERSMPERNDHVHVVVDGSGFRNVVDPVRTVLGEQGSIRTIYSYNPTFLYEVLMLGAWIPATKSAATGNQFLMHGFVLLNGRKLDARDASNIDPRSIDSLVIMTGTVAESTFSDPLSKYGAIEIFTKQ